MGIKDGYKFDFGQIVYTRGIEELLDYNEIFFYLNAHGLLAHGCLCDEDYQMNVEAVKNGDRILSAFMHGNKKIYVITEWDRSATTVLLASEY